MAYTAAAQVSGAPRYRAVVEDIVSYVARDLTHPLGGFYSAEDADSFPTADSEHKREGAFCVWTWAEVEALLGQEQGGMLEELGHKERGGRTLPWALGGTGPLRCRSPRRRNRCSGQRCRLWSGCGRREG